MAEPTVQVPVSLLKGLRDALAEHDDPHCEVDNYASDQVYISHVDALLSQPTAVAEPRMVALCTVCESPIIRILEDATRPWRHADGFHAHPAIGPLPDGQSAESIGALDAKIDALGLRDFDEPARPDSLPFPHAKADRMLAGPHRIDDLAPGTTFTAQMIGSNREHRLTAPDFGVQYHVADRDVWIHRRDIDPSTIRDVTPPTESTK